jgi:hypothetical protein
LHLNRFYLWLAESDLQKLKILKMNLRCNKQIVDQDCAVPRGVLEAARCKGGWRSSIGVRLTALIPCEFFYMVDAFSRTGYMFI